MKEITLDDLDMQVIHALQVDPRASWSAIAPLIGSDEVTLARRWSRIASSGVAWQTAMDDRHPSSAIVEVSCEPGASVETADAAAADPRILSIDLTSGRRDLVLTVTASDPVDLAEYAIEQAGRLPGVRSVQTHVVNTTFKVGAHWTVRALSDALASRVPRPRPPRRASAKTVPSPMAAAICDALSGDVRMSYAHLGERVGISPQRAADYLARLRADGGLVLRTDVADAYSSWPVVCWYFVQAPTQTIQAARDLFLRLPELQLAVAASGPHNLIIAGSARSIPDILERESALEATLPGARIADRSLVLRAHKRLGRRILADGRAAAAL